MQNNDLPITERVFVYGTLRADCPSGAHRRYLQGAELVGKGRVRGHLYQAGYAPGLIYPALVLDDRAGGVLGEVYQLCNAAQLAALDAYEEYDSAVDSDQTSADKSAVNQEYSRRLVPVTCDQGAVIMAWVYAYARPVSGLRLIATGDFLNPDLPLTRPLVDE
jgi:gamma-glutamylcyclotransferase (GGCT)/AIG2-like uncharacterized protein YtfP